jgi:hypothetical protein
VTFPFPAFSPNNGSKAVVNYHTATSAISTASSWSPAGLAIGTAAANRYVLVGVSYQTGSGALFSSVTIGGIAATQLNVITTGIPTAFYMALVPTGTTATVVVTLTANAIRWHIGVWSITGLSTPVPYAAPTVTANPPSLTFNAQPGVVIGHATGIHFTTTQSWTWTGLTEDFDLICSSAPNYDQFTGAKATLTSSQSLTVTATKTGTYNNDHLNVVAFR